MSTTVSWEKRYTPSDDVVAREIAGEVVIVPLTGGIGETDNDLFSVNSTGREIWRRLDGKNRLCDVVDDILDHFDASRSVIEEDVLGFINELVQRRIVAEIAD
jgi:hypothetical protein